MAAQLSAEEWRLLSDAYRPTAIQPHMRNWQVALDMKVDASNGPRIDIRRPVQFSQLEGGKLVRVQGLPVLQVSLDVKVDASNHTHISVKEPLRVSPLEGGKLGEEQALTDLLQ